MKWNSFCLGEVLSRHDLIKSVETARRENPVIFLFLTLLNTTCDRGRKKRRILWPETEFRRRDSCTNMSTKRALFSSVQCEAVPWSPRIICAVFWRKTTFSRRLSTSLLLRKPSPRWTRWNLFWLPCAFPSTEVNLDLFAFFMRL